MLGAETIRFTLNSRSRLTPGIVLASEYFSVQASLSDLRDGRYWPLVFRSGVRQRNFQRRNATGSSGRLKRLKKSQLICVRSIGSPVGHL